MPHKCRIEWCPAMSGHEWTTCPDARIIAVSRPAACPSGLRERIANPADTPFSGVWGPILDTRRTNGARNEDRRRPGCVLDLAKRHRWRTRNLHDGHPVPPAKRPPRGNRGQDAFGADDDRMDAIVGQFGYIVLEGDGLGWFLVAATRPPHGKIAKIREAGGKVNQLGDREAGGTAPTSAMKTLTKLIGVYRVVSDEVRLAASERGKKAFEKCGMPQMSRASH